MAAATFHGTGHEEVADISRRLSAALAAARHDDGEHPVRGRAALLGPERDAHRHARGPDRDGRVHQPAAAARGCAGWSHGSSPSFRRSSSSPLRRARHRTAAHPEPGGSQPAAAVRGVSARAFTSDRGQDGRRSSNPLWVKVLAWTVAVIIAALNVWLLYQTFVGV